MDYPEIYEFNTVFGIDGIVEASSNPLRTDDGKFDRLVRAEIEGRIARLQCRRLTETRPARYPRETR